MLTPEELHVRFMITWLSLTAGGMFLFLFVIFLSVYMGWIEGPRSLD
jgi:hypothetical protein